MNEETQAKVSQINKEETLKLNLTDSLQQTTRLAGTFKINALMYEDEALVKLLNEGAEALNKFNKGLAEYLAK